MAVPTALQAGMVCVTVRSRWYDATLDEREELVARFTVRRGNSSGLYGMVVSGQVCRNGTRLGDLRVWPRPYYNEHRPRRSVFGAGILTVAWRSFDVNTR